MKKVLIILILIIFAISSCGKEKEVIVEQTEFDVEIVDYKNKLKAIRAIDKYTDNNYREAKKIIKNIPIIILEDVNKETAEDLKEKLEEKGLTVVIK